MIRINLIRKQQEEGPLFHSHGPNEVISYTNVNLKTEKGKFFPCLHVVVRRSWDEHSMYRVNKVRPGDMKAN